MNADADTAQNHSIREVEMVYVSRWLLALAGLALVAGAAPAKAAMVTVPLIGQFTFVLDAPGVQVAVGDRVAGQVRYDPSLVAPAGYDELALGEGGLTFDLAGLLTLTEADDSDFGGGVYPLAVFQDGGLVGLDFQVAKIIGLGGLPTFVNFGIFGLSFQWQDPFGATLLAGDLQVVPVPAALPLLATGVAALVFWRRRQRA